MYSRSDHQRSAYISQLNKQVAAVSPPSEPPSLRQRFVEWYQNLPEFSRVRAFSMSEFETAMATQGKYISPVLLKLGWRRRRIWSTGGQYHRYWQPPHVD